MTSMQLNPVVIGGSGLWTPEHTITNAELVAAYNRWAERYNDRHTWAIASGHLDPKPLSSVAFIEKASGIKQRYANTASAGSLIAFHLYHEDLAAGDHGMICSFGAGYAIGSLVVRKR